MINGRTNADVTITNETTGDVWHGDSNGIEQAVDIIIGEKEEETAFDIVAHHGDVLRVNYSPYPHFAEKHEVTMTVRFMNIETITVGHSPFEAKYTVGADVPNGIHSVTVIGISDNTKDKCYLNESRTVKVKIE